MKSRLRIIVTGLIAQYPLGGVTWDYLQYVTGLARLGHEVYYLEDTGFWPYNPTSQGLDRDGCDYNVNYLASVMKAFGLADRWMYRLDYSDQWYGLTDQKRQHVLSTADILINVSGCLARPAHYSSVKKRVFIDSDPVFTQVKLLSGYQSFRHQVNQHDILFSFAENPNHCIPDTGDTWHPTRQPVVLSEWIPQKQRRQTFTTIMNWTSYKSLEYNGQTYGQKNVEFEKFITLPDSLPADTFELAIAAGKTSPTPRKRLLNHGWRLVSPESKAGDLHSYRDYIQRSFGEWSVAKNGYVEGRSGWFSCRSACYLASARPVVVQDTGFGDRFPMDSGVAAFSTADSALAAIDAFRSKPKTFSDAARDTAVSYFDSDKVLQALIETTMNHQSVKVVAA